jgi:hypothetical protein
MLREGPMVNLESKVSLEDGMPRPPVSMRLLKPARTKKLCILASQMLFDGLIQKNFRWVS